MLVAHDGDSPNSEISRTEFIPLYYRGKVGDDRYRKAGMYSEIPVP